MTESWGEMIPWIRADTETSPVVDTESTNRGIIRASLVCVSGPDLGTAFPVGKSSVVIGRSHADITIARR